MKKAKKSSDDIFEDIKLKMVMRINNIDRQAATKRISIQKERKSYSRAKHEDGREMMTADEFFADPE